jgi:orotate phosphoribosyltransferase
VDNAMNPDYVVGSIRFSELVLYLLAFGGLIAVADFIGILPASVAKWLARNRVEVMLQALKRVGVRACWDEQTSSVRLVNRLLSSTGIKEPLYKIQLRAMLDEDTFNGDVHIGENRWFTSDRFVDVMGACTDPQRAAQYARILNTHAHFAGAGEFDVVATPKSGSSILGYEFAKLTGKPFVTGIQRKVQSANEQLAEHSCLDYSRNLQLKGRRVLLVDDSTTGGRKMLDLAEQLRSMGCVVDQALVLFEPKGKGARDALKAQQIGLMSVQDGPVGSF